MNRLVNKQECYDYISSMIGTVVTDDTYFFDEAGLFGLDAFQFMVQFSERYHINLDGYEPENFHESDIGLGNIFEDFWRAINGRIPRHISFTALHLYDVALTGKWFDPIAGTEPHR